MDVQGGQGGTAGVGGYTGGLGGRTQATIPVTSGEILYIYTGGGGGGVTFNYDGSRAASNSYDVGWNGGGTGNNTNAGGGGGASDIRRNEFTVASGSNVSGTVTLTTSAAHGFTVGSSIIAGTVRGPSAPANATSLASRVVVAGGGGGAGYFANGGAGGGLVGGSSSGSSGTTSFGATQTSGNALGVGKSVFGTASGNAGGGGGGYWGGGVSTASNVGGGGGSSYAPDQAAAVFLTQGYRTGDGFVGITVPLSTSASGLAAAAGDRQVALSWSSSASSNLVGYSLLGGTTPNPTTVIATVAATESSYLHEGPSFSVTTRQLTSNVATLTTSSAHGFVIGQTVKVSDISSVFNGTFVISAVTSTTFSYSKVNANLAAASTIGTATLSTGLTNGTTYYYRVAPILLLNDVRTTAPYSSIVSATPTTVTSGTYSYTGAPLAFTVPAGVAWLQVDARAGQGGTAGANGYAGGLGGRTQATIPVTAGETLYLYVGGAGGRAGSISAANTYDVGWNGGGTGNNTAAGGGGGASDIRRNEFTVTNKSLASNVATLTTSLPHGFAVGAAIVVAGVDATFNGSFTVTSVPTTTTFRYAKTASNVASTLSSGTVRGPSLWSNSASLASRAIVAGGGGGAGYYAAGGAGGGLVGGSSSGSSGTTSFGGTQTSGNALGVGKSVFGTASGNAGGGGG
ncbi:MAG: glycine-rich protein, partial [Actinobacteria bacterium]|nr:glycine-rich protein [Actinomycetota bacterium]